MGGSETPVLRSPAGEPPTERTHKSKCNPIGEMVNTMVNTYTPVLWPPAGAPPTERTHQSK